jgi:hypothetical protein
MPLWAMIGEPLAVAVRLNSLGVSQNDAIHTRSLVGEMTGLSLREENSCQNFRSHKVVRTHLSQSGLVQPRGERVNNERLRITNINTSLE